MVRSSKIKSPHLKSTAHSPDAYCAVLRGTMHVYCDGAALARTQADTYLDYKKAPLPSRMHRWQGVAV